MNNCNFIGNLSKDPVLSETPNGVKVATFTIAVQRRFPNADGERVADFINCVAWRNQAENLAKYCKKGDKIAVRGSLQVRNYENKDGEKRYVTEIIADEIEFLKLQKTAQKGEEKPTLEEVQEELPF